MDYVKTKDAEVPLQQAVLTNPKWYRNFIKKPLITEKPNSVRGRAINDRYRTPLSFIS
jgi:hypothetical protein